MLNTLGMPMVTKPLHHARILFGHLAAVTLLLLAGCASAPEQPEPEVPQPVEEPVQESESAPLVSPAPVELRAKYPEKYVVVKGDTLWDIAARFLKSPWQWPQLWQINPQVENPHLIYPGDVLTIYFIDGKPVLRVQRKGEGEGEGERVQEYRPVEDTVPEEVLGRHYPTVKLSPRVREIGLEEAVPTIPFDAINPFLTRPRVVTRDELERAPYVVAHADDHLASGGGYRIYARDLEKESGDGDYILVRSGQTYRDPNTGKVLGYEAVYLGEARLQRYGDPSTLLVTESSREILRGDRLLPAMDNVYQLSFLPRAPEHVVDANIIAVFDGVAQIGQYQVVVLNLGRQEDIEAGHVLAVIQRGTRVKDIVGGGSVKLPDERAGEVMIFRVFEKVSYALVMRATKAMHVKDRVTNP